MVLVAPVVVRVIGRQLLAPDVEVRRRDARTGDALRPDRLLVDGQTPERAADVVERQAGIDERAENHVARCA